MKTVLIRFCLAALLVLPFGANAMMNETETRAVVTSMLAETRSAGDIISALMADGRDLVAATVFALVAGGQENRVAFAEAGIAAATSVAEAQSVVNALIATAGTNSPVAEAAALALTEYQNTMAPPGGYQGGGVATGGGDGGQDVSGSL